MKRSLLIFAGILLLVPAAAAANKEVPLEELKAKAESTAGDQKPMLYAEIVHREIEDANHLFVEGDVEKAQGMLKEAVVYAGKARDACLTRPRKMKDTEIHLRKAEHRLNDIRRTLALEDQADVQAAADQIAAMRKQILEAMFAPKRKK